MEAVAMKRIDLNCDLGESFGAWRMGDDDALLALISSASIACGFHAGDPDIMQYTVTQAMAFTSALLSIVRNSTRRPTGVIIAPPTPCRIRAITKPVTDPDNAQPIEPAMKTAIAVENTSRGPKRSAVQPLAGMNTARDRRY